MDKEITYKEKREAVKQRTYKILEHNKKVLLPLVERAFLSGAIDIEDAYESEDIIPSAIVLAAFMSITSDMQSSASEEVIEEANNIFEMI